ncbi:hypothetical protein TRFO_27555 [Tritrichomonas foetus]|uniref:Uncharacterized protein n=1 Tax=Tritrichomonas foetus TaxID=1144522 RepID=A0A1J4K272_9EUKA|nr:hypothetical protein TRFO_27555 [Tritrichomonas foetus]|eukprot:OHT04880.1 hypothetical protein TRFO_27555 [Tritrichomonas foetus]
MSSRGQREYPPRSYSNNYQRRYQDSRDYRSDFDDRREKVDRVSSYDNDKNYDRSDRNIDRNADRNIDSRQIESRQMSNSGIPISSSGYSSRYESRGRPPSAGYFDRENSRRKYNSSYESQTDHDLPRRTPEAQIKGRDRSPADYVTESERIAEMIRKEYQINPPVQMNIAPVFMNIELWD